MVFCRSGPFSCAYSYLDSQRGAVPGADRFSLNYHGRLQHGPLVGKKGYAAERAQSADEVSMNIIKVLLRLANIIGYGKSKVRDRWEDEYRSGSWEYLNQIDELAHYSILAGYVKYFKKGGAVLDLGSGGGILAGKLDPSDYAEYVGIEFSGTAVDQSLKYASNKISFIQEDITDYVPKRKFSHIILNEVLTYFKDPLAILKRYEAYLESGGIYLISLYKDSRAEEILKKITAHYQVIDKVQVSNERKAWTCAALKPIEA